MVTVLQPMWTEQLRSVGGQDHLGVGTVVTGRILPTLLPGINVLTPRPRYWSFYAFVIDEFWRRDLPRTGAELRRFIRQKESIYSIAGHLCTNPTHRGSPIGTRKVRPLIDSAPASFDPSFDYMRSRAGGYGLYYATVLQSMGLIRLADRDLGLPVDAVTPEIGTNIADAFRSAISNTAYWRTYFDSDEVPADVVEEYASVACLCQLQANAPDRAPLVDAFLHGGYENAAGARRLSLQMMLEIAKQSTDTAISQDDFRRLVLYQATYDTESGEETAIFAPPESLEDVARRWRISQLREMLNWSLNGLWQWLCEWGQAQNGDIIPVALSDLRRSIDDIGLSQVPGVTCDANSPIGSLIDECLALAQMTGSLDGPWNLWVDLSEDHLFNLVSRRELEPLDQLAALAVMYVMCLTRLGADGLMTELDPADQRLLEEGGFERIGIVRAHHLLQRDRRLGRSIADVVWRIIDDQVIAQHERVALRKLPDDTYRFRRDAGRLQFFPLHAGFQRNDARYNAMSTVCAEIGWCDYLNEAPHHLTSEGEQIRVHGDLQAR